MSFSVDAYGVMVHGAPPYFEPSLIEADALHVGITVASLLRRSWYVNELRLEHPVARVFVDRNGHTNLPAGKKQDASPVSSSNLFDLGIRHLMLDRGEIYFNNRKSDLSGDLRDFSLQAAFEAVAKRYTGSLSYRDGHLQIKNTKTVGHGLQAHFAATPKQFRVDSAELQSGNSRLTAVGNIRDYSQPQMHFTYEASIDCG
jgi:uncharacterized protein involved in outer membrane biogenesis